MKIKAITRASAAVKLKALSRPGCYCLIIILANKRTLRIGQRGRVKFSTGTYVYTGSAMSGLAGRLTRHLTRQKTLRWHIDYLLSSANARVTDILTYRSAPGRECRRNHFVERLPGAQVIMRRFGASDCRAGCAAHLYFFPTMHVPAGVVAALKRHSTRHLKIK